MNFCDLDNFSQFVVEIEDSIREQLPNMPGRFREAVDVSRLSQENYTYLENCGPDSPLYCGCVLSQIDASYKGGLGSFDTCDSWFVGDKKSLAFFPPTDPLDEVVASWWSIICTLLWIQEISKKRR